MFAIKSLLLLSFIVAIGSALPVMDKSAKSEFKDDYSPANDASNPCNLKRQNNDLGVIGSSWLTSPTSENSETTTYGGGLFVPIREKRQSNDMDIIGELSSFENFDNYESLIDSFGDDGANMSQLDS